MEGRKVGWCSSRSYLTVCYWENTSRYWKEIRMREVLWSFMWIECDRSWTNLKLYGNPVSNFLCRRNILQIQYSMQKFYTKKYALKSLQRSKYSYVLLFAFLFSGNLNIYPDVVRFFYFNFENWYEKADQKISIYISILIYSRHQCKNIT